MTGLDKIIKVIEDDAAKAAKAVIAEAENNANEIILAAKKEGKKKQSEIAKDSQDKIRALQSRAESAAVLQRKKLILNSKINMINNLIDKAKETIKNTSEEEYFDIIIKLIVKHSHNKTGEVIFSSKDLDRLPADFEVSINKALEVKEGASLNISKETREIDSGCLLVYGDIEENCSIDALFMASNEELQDGVSEILFK